MMIAPLRQTAHAALLLLAAALLTACDPPAPVSMPAADRMQLEVRARDLLLEAARSDIDIVSCNAIESLVQVAPREATNSIRQALRSPYPLVRFAACVAVGELADKGSYTVILRLIDDSEPRVRLGAAFAAYRLGERDFGRTLASAVIHEKDENLRSDAAYLIGRLRDPAALHYLRAALEHPDNQKTNRVRVHILTAMAMLGDKDAVNSLIAYTQGDAISRVISLQSLAELGSEAAREPLLYRLSDSNDYLENRLIAARGLGKIGSPAGFQLALAAVQFTSADAVTMLGGRGPAAAAAAAEDPNLIMRVRTLGALALGDIGEPRALDALRQLAETEGDERVQVAACYAICKIIGR